MEIISKEEQIMYENLITGGDDRINVKKIPLLTEDQVRELVELRDQGYNEAITKLVFHNLGLIKKVAMRYSYAQNSYDDLFQEGVIGLMEAAKRYDINKNASFATYAWYWIRNTILRSVYNKGELIRIPVWIREKERKILSIQSELCNEFKREPTIDEISKISGIDYDDVNFILNVHKKNYSFDGPIINKDEEPSLIDVIPNENASDPEDISEKLDFQVANEILEVLTPRERQIIKLRFGFETGYELNRAEVARFLNVSYQYVQQSEDMAIKKVKKSKYVGGLIEKLDGYEDILGMIEEKSVDCFTGTRSLERRSRDDIYDYFREETKDNLWIAINNLNPEVKELFFKYYDYSLKRRPNYQLSKKEIIRINNAFVSIRRNLKKISDDKREESHQKVKVISNRKQSK